MGWSRKNGALPSQHRLCLRRHPPEAQPPAHELARPRDDLIDNAKPRMTILNTYYAKPPKAGEEENEYR